jgi:epoxyqueuosine reductase
MSTGTDRGSIQRLVEAEELLFLGIVDLDCTEDYERFRRWLEESRQAGMGFLERNLDCRRDPASLLPGARTAVLFALPYACGDREESAPHPPRIAQYARFRDYHRLLWQKGEAIAQGLCELADNSATRCRVTVDSAPILERALAAKSAQGFIGKNTLYIHPRHGSFLLLGEILTTATLPVDAKTPVPTERKTLEGGCGPCNRCQVNCPTGALAHDYTLDAKRCLAYWTIEHRGTIPEEFWPWLGHYYFGCDICQLVCPYNRKGEAGRHSAAMTPRTFPSLLKTATMTPAEYQTYFGGTPLTRAKRGGLRRNALIAMAVTGDPGLPEALIAADRDPESPVGETAVQIDRWIRSARNNPN